jgi:hypothetical protein
LQKIITENLRRIGFLEMKCLIFQVELLKFNEKNLFSNIYSGRFNKKRRKEIGLFSNMHVV